MTYTTYSDSAPTGAAENGKQRVSPNEYSVLGRTNAYPDKFSLFVNKRSQVEGTVVITAEPHDDSEFVGDRLYLDHRPLVEANGTVTTVTPSAGTIDNSQTNAKQGYVVFSSKPVGSFTLSYTAAPDCFSMWHLNVLQDDIMEMQQILGPTNLTGWAGLRNLTYGLFDSPSDPFASGVAQNAIFLPHLNQDVRISSTDDPTLAATLGTGWTIQLGYQSDEVVADVTGFHIRNSAGGTFVGVSLGTRTGDSITMKGTMSGAYPWIVGGSEWAGFSGGRDQASALSGSTGYYDNSLLRVHGDVAVMGDIQAVGSFTFISVTGESSSIQGSLVVRDMVSVFGTTELNGPTLTNDLTVRTHEYLKGDLIAQNELGNGGNGQTLLDNLDASEVAHTYQAAIQRRIPNSVVSGPVKTGHILPKNEVWGPNYHLTGNQLCGDVFAITGDLNAPAGPSGAHPHIVQIIWSLPLVSGTLNNSGTLDGIWSPGMMDPGTTWLEVINGSSSGYRAPVYGYTIEEVSGSILRRLNVFTPEGATPNISDGDLRLYSPYSVPYEFITAAGGASPTATIFGTDKEPLRIAFEDHVRVHKGSSQISLTTTLNRSVSGMGSVPTGVAYIFADSVNVDVENPPAYLSRPIPFRMPGETVIGEVVATKSGSTWTIRETTSYRPGGVYDSSWIPIMQDGPGDFSGRMTPYMPVNAGDPVRFYFNHQLGADIDLARTSADLYLGATGTVNAETIWPNDNHVFVRSFLGSDVRHGLGLSGSFVRIPLHTSRFSGGSGGRDASIFYMDGKIIGIEFDPKVALATDATTVDFDYLRLVVRRDS